MVHRWDVQLSFDSLWSGFKLLCAAYSPQLPCELRSWSMLQCIRRRVNIMPCMVAASASLYARMMDTNLHERLLSYWQRGYTQQQNNMNKTDVPADPAECTGLHGWESICWWWLWEQRSKTRYHKRGQYIKRPSRRKNPETNAWALRAASAARVGRRPLKKMTGHNEKPHA